MLAFVFPGQGSQRKKMGEGMFDATPEFVAVEKFIDEQLGYSLRQLCLEDPNNRLKDTRYTQPALFVANALHYYTAVREGARPQYLAGHSLGEYNALHAAGVFDLLTGVRIVQRRGDLMGRAQGGGMAAVVGLDPQRIADVLRDNALSSVDVANFNSPAQTVVSGPEADIKRATPLFEKAGARMCMPLEVSAAFHSRYMAPAAESFADFLMQFNFAVPALPVIANVTAEPYPQDAGSIRKLLVQQITRSVQWTQTVRNLAAKGVQFKEIGPGNVLTRLIQQIQQ